jgi:hypothetical protein
LGKKIGFSFYFTEKQLEINLALKSPDSLIVEDLREDLVENFEPRFFKNVLRMNDITFLFTHNLALIFLSEKLCEVENSFLYINLEVLMEVLAEDDLFRQQIHDSIKFVFIFNNVFFIFDELKTVHFMKELHEGVFEVNRNLDMWDSGFIINGLRTLLYPFRIEAGMVE